MLPPWLPRPPSLLRIWSALFFLFAIGGCVNHGENELDMMRNAMLGCACLITSSVLYAANVIVIAIDRKRT